jgi:hypothetical protein
MNVENRATLSKRNKRKAVTSGRVTRPTSKRFSEKEKTDPDIASETASVNIIYDSNK